MTNILPYFAASLPGSTGWPIALAHRGADVHRENSLSAVSAAVEQGFGYIELDVRATSDGKVVVFHDEELDRITTGTGKLSQHTWEELSPVQLVGSQPGQTEFAEPLVLFEQLLEQFPDTHFNVDLKDKASAKPMVDILRRQRAWGRVLIASFRDSHRREFFNYTHAADPAIASSAGIETVAVLLGAHRLGILKPVARWLRKRLPLHALQVPAQQGPIRVVTQDFVDACHGVGIVVHVWVVNDSAEMEDLLAMGVDGLVTDNGPGIADILSVRGQWPQRS